MFNFIKSTTKIHMGNQKPNAERSKIAMAYDPCITAPNTHGASYINVV